METTLFTMFAYWREILKTAQTLPFECLEISEWKIVQKSQCVGRNFFPTTVDFTCVSHSAAFVNEILKTLEMCATCFLRFGRMELYQEFFEQKNIWQSHSLHNRPVVENTLRLPLLSFIEVSIRMFDLLMGIYLQCKWGFGKRLRNRVILV